MLSIFKRNHIDDVMTLADELSMMRRRNEMRMEEAKRQLGAQYIFHPEYKGIRDEKLNTLRSLAGDDYVIYKVIH